MRTGLSLAVSVEGERVVLQGKAFFFGDLVLSVFYLCVKKFLNPPAVKAYQVVMVTALVEFKHRLSRLEVGTQQDTSLLKLREHPVDCRQPDIHVFCQHHLIDILGAEMAGFGLFEDCEYFEPGNGDLEPCILQVGGKMLLDRHAAYDSEFVSSAVFSSEFVVQSGL